MHTVIDDHSRVAYAEIHDDEKAATAIGVVGYSEAAAALAATGGADKAVLESAAVRDLFQQDLEALRAADRC